MNALSITTSNTKFPLGWHAILNEFVMELLAVEYLYGPVVASVGMNISPVHLTLRAFLLSEAPRRLRAEASDVLDQVHHRIHERTRSTCSICGCPARSMVSHCGEHSDIQLVPYAELKPPTNPAWRLADFHMLIEGGTGDDVIRTMSNNQQQLDAASAFVQTYHAPEISQILSQAHSMRASNAIEVILSR